MRTPDEDMKNMHDHYKIREVVKTFNSEQLLKFLEFRLNFLEEELIEGFQALNRDDAEEVVDALIDLVVIAIGTLDLFDVDFKKAWDEVLRANMTKKVGIKKSRPNPLGLPDLIKPDGWVGPSHEGNHGLITKAFEDS